MVENLKSFIYILAKRSNKKRKFRSRIYLLTIMTMTVIIMILSLFSYYNVEDLIEKNEYKANIKLFSQINYNISLINDMLYNFSTSIFFDWDTIYVMNSERVEMENLIPIIENLKKSKFYMDAFVHAINIYNHNTEEVYSTNNDIFYEDTSIMDLVRSGTNVPKMKLVHRQITQTDPNGNQKLVDIFSFVMYQSVSKSGAMEGALILDIKPESLNSNIRTINRIENNEADMQFIFDKNATVLAGNTREESTDGFIDELRKIIREEINGIDFNQKGIVSSTVNKIGRGKYIITYFIVDKADWLLVRVQEYNRMNKITNDIKVIFLVVTGVILILSYLIFIAISGYIYKPIKDLVSAVDDKALRIIAKPEDEISYLSELYNHYKNEIKYDKKMNREIIKNYILGNLIIDSMAIKQDDLDKMFDDKILSIAFNSPVMVSVIRLDLPPNSKEGRNIEEDDLLVRYAAAKIIHEVMSENFNTEVVNFQNNLIVVLNETQNMEYDDWEKRMILSIQQAQQYTVQYYGLSFSVSLGRPAVDYKQISTSYDDAAHNLNYRFLLGNTCIITNDIIALNLGNSHYTYSEEMETKVRKYIQDGSSDDIQEILPEIFDEISKLNYENMLFSLGKLINALRDHLDDAGKDRLTLLEVHLKHINNGFSDISTLDDVFNRILDIMENSNHKQEGSLSRKQILMVETMRDIIHANYQDCSIGVQYIANMMKMSPAYAGRIFKIQEGCSVNEYINDYRLFHITNCILNNNDNIALAAEKAGFSSESYFYRRFKRKFGVTPKEYIIQRAKEQLQVEK